MSSKQKNKIKRRKHKRHHSPNRKRYRNSRSGVTVSSLKKGKNRKTKTSRSKAERGGSGASKKIRLSNDEFEKCEQNVEKTQEIPDTKNQHFVPQTYQKHFAKRSFNGHMIYTLPNKITREENIKSMNIKNICVEKDLYTLPGDTRKERMYIETFYSGLEKNYDKIYAILTNPNIDTITNDERKLIISTVVTMLFRTTKLKNKHNEVVKRAIEKLYQITKNLNKDIFSFEGEDISIINKTAKDIYKENRHDYMLTQLEVALKLIDMRINTDSVHIIKLTDNPDHQFITSDNPISYDTTSPADPSSILTLPLDDKHLLMLMPSGNNEDFNKIYRKNLNETMSSNQKIISNGEQHQNSDKFLLGSESALKGFMSDSDYYKSL